MRVKIVDAWRWGAPVVTTTVGAEGIAYTPGVELLLADSPADFAAAVLRVLGDRALGEALVAATRRRIRIETEAKIIIQQKVKDAECELLRSSILDFECAMNPFPEHRIAILNWRKVACATIMADEVVLDHARRLLAYGVGEYEPSPARRRQHPDRRRPRHALPGPGAGLAGCRLRNAFCGDGDARWVTRRCL